MAEIEWLAFLVGDNDGAISLWQMLVRGTIIFIYGLILFRLATPRLFGKGTPIDILLAVIIGSNLSRTLTGNAPFVEVLLTTGFLVLLHTLLTKIALRWRPLADLIKGKPTVLIEDGEVNDAAMRSSALGQRDLLAAIRAAGGMRIEDVKLATLERGGEIDVILKK
ncbi:MAG TPA: YetF domain-containing protein [Alphaproteobacteria bacterium]|nr:YetF domain-containing protein [Alphaproteobacteria bacterium]